MLNRLNIAAGMLALAVSVTAVAQERSSRVSPNPYTDCGIGAALFQETQWAAVTSNVIWDLGSTALTSATASPETCTRQYVQTARFILDNYENLAEETARGQGEHLTAMLNIRGCKVEDHSGIIQSIRSDMATQVGASAYRSQDIYEKSNHYFQALSAGVEKASGGCS